MNNKLLAVFVLSLVFSVSSVSAKPDGNGNGNGKGNGNDDNRDVASATSSEPQQTDQVGIEDIEELSELKYPKVNFGLFKAQLDLGCLRVENAGEANDGAWQAILQQQGRANVWKVVYVKKLEGVDDCLELFGNLPPEELEEE